MSAFAALLDPLPKENCGCSRHWEHVQRCCRGLRVARRTLRGHTPASQQARALHIFAFTLVFILFSCAPWVAVALWSCDKVCEDACVHCPERQQNLHVDHA